MRTKRRSITKASIFQVDQPVHLEAAGKRHGSGEEELVDELSKKIGYSRYKGQWKNDKFHGTGDLYYADINDSDTKRLLFQGTFADGMREGEGKLYDKHADGEERRLKLKCKFERDKIAASKKEQWVWARLDGDEDQGRDCKFFFGALEFKEKKNSDQFYDEIADGSGRVLKYTLYHGAFKDNLPDGFGLQHFQGAREGKEEGFHGGTYTGEFKNGKRHGRGTWKALDGDWEFRPISTETSIQNFENDWMHGIGIVEDSQHVHENVIYTKGKCQMPFTELGPPKTGFESAALNDMMPQAKNRRAMVTPLPTIWDASKPKEQDPIWALLKGFGRQLKCMSVEAFRLKLCSTVAGVGAMPGRRSRSRDRRDRRSYSRSRDRRSRDRRSPRRREDDRRPPRRSPVMTRIPPPPKKEEPEEGVTLEQRQNAIECEGHLYAAIDFTPPQSVPDIGLDVTPRYYQPNVIKPFPWGTHLLVAKDSKAYQTAKGERPGSLEMLWDYAKDPAKGYRLESKVGMNARWHGRLLIRSKVCFASG
ncbi:hypothetical protein AK812_SmicGene21130 [Symbiodinium microadriaticum]|uniref:MORN repeat-containing protein n=1 Tax=Symbiodinium microadriaticum TaxID=2951 RepID=A0A1Q9DN79_SYMMI|nr:hypothetical protein AK812_SmicGene21130 [Symbiodinium microadriaticum]